MILLRRKYHRLSILMSVYGGVLSYSLLYKYDNR